MRADRFTDDDVCVEQFLKLMRRNHAYIIQILKTSTVANKQTKLTLPSIEIEIEIDSQLKIAPSSQSVEATYGRQTGAENKKIVSKRNVHSRSNLHVNC
jgi:hypothetical protein